jgi:hypothetical protein
VTLGNDDEASTVVHNFLSSVVTHFVTRELTWDISPEPMAALRASIRPIRANIPLRQILEEDFPRDCTGLPIAGGWGYIQRDAVVFVPGQFPLPSLDDYRKLEHHIVQKIIHEELIVSRKTGEGFSGIDARVQSQQAITESGRTFDCLDFTISCWSDRHWEFLKTEWEDNRLRASSRFRPGRP